MLLPRRQQGLYDRNRLHAMGLKSSLLRPHFFGRRLCETVGAIAGTTCLSAYQGPWESQ